jgi:hypothetical protein
LCFYFPAAPRCGYRRLPGQQRHRLWAGRRRGTSSRCCRCRRRVTVAAAAAAEGAGRGEGGGGKGMKTTGMGGVGGPAAPPFSGPLPTRKGHRLTLLPAPSPRSRLQGEGKEEGGGGDEGVGYSWRHGRIFVASDAFAAAGCIACGRGCAALGRDINCRD